MKSKLLNKTWFVILCVSLSISARCPETFDSKIVSDFKRHSYFLVITIKDQKGVGTVAVQNLDLYSFLRKNNIIRDRSEYMSKITKALQGNDTLDLSSCTGKQFGFLYKKSLSHPIDSIAKQGKDKFISTYFENKVLKSQILNSEKPYIIEKLFNWCVLCKTDDETGALIIEN